MISVDGSRNLFVIKGDSGTVLAEVCSVLKIFTEAVEQNAPEEAEGIKALIIDQIQSNFDEERVDLFFNEDGGIKC